MRRDDKQPPRWVDDDRYQISSTVSWSTERRSACTIFITCREVWSRGHPTRTRAHLPSSHLTLKPYLVPHGVPTWLDLPSSICVTPGAASRAQVSQSLATDDLLYLTPLFGKRWCVHRWSIFLFSFNSHLSLHLALPPPPLSNSGRNGTELMRLRICYTDRKLLRFKPFSRPAATYLPGARYAHTLEHSGPRRGHGTSSCMLFSLPPPLLSLHVAI